MKTTIRLLTIAMIICSASWTPMSANEPAGLADYTLKKPGFEWITAPTDHYRIHYLPGSRAESEIETLVQRNEAILASHLAILGAKKYDKIIDLFYFDSRDQIEQIVTKPFRALADAENMTVLAVRNKNDIARDAHEIMHVVSYDLWGRWEARSELAWLSEGLATYSDEPCNGHEMSELAAYILKNTNDAVALDSLAADFRKYPEMVGYILMAGFVDFVLNKYGLEYLRRLWDEGYGGLETIFGKERTVIEQEWHQYLLDKYPNPKIPDWLDLKDHGCK